MSVCAAQKLPVASLNDSILENMGSLPVRSSGGRKVAAHRVKHTRVESPAPVFSAALKLTRLHAPGLVFHLH